jgi:penicillin-binding protein 1A
VTLKTALAQSLNSVSAQLTEMVTPQAVAATARRLGIVSPLMETPSIALGTSEVTPLELTAAYVPFSNGGRGIIPYAIKRISTAKGQVLFERSGTGPGQVVDPAYVGMMNSMLSETVIDGTGTKARVAGWPVAGKTGTSQDFRDAWFIGYTGALTAGVWFGNDNNAPSKHATGGSLPAMAWQRFMSAALDGQAVADLPGNYHFGDPTNVRYAGRPLYPSDMTGAQTQGAPMVLGPGANTGPVAAGPEMPQGGWIDQPSGGPVPPGTVGPRRRQGPITGFLQQLFGG